MIVFIDQDGPLADFHTEACLLHGLDPAEVLANTVAGEWDMVPAMARVLATRNSLPTFDLDAFWKPIHEAGDGFWMRLWAAEWFWPLVKYVEELVGDQWYVLTAPSRCPTSYSGKVKWLKERFGQKFNRVIPFGEKELLAHVPQAVLIDDSDSNCEKFRANGGEAIVFPFHWNSRHAVKDRALEVVCQDLLKLKEKFNASQDQERQHCLPPTRYGLR